MHTDIRLLFPQDNLHLWFYEITGVIEFFLGLLVALLLFKYIHSHNSN